MKPMIFSDQDRAILLDLTAELRRYNDNSEKEKPDTWFSFREAGEYIGRTYQTISSWSKSGILHPKLIGRSKRIAKSELDKMIRK
jgi:hypothetical protein